MYVRGGIRKKINDGKIKYLLVIVVNAKNEPPQKFDREESPPGLATVGLKTCTISMDNYSFETIESIKRIFEERIKAQQYIGALTYGTAIFVQVPIKSKADRQLKRLKE